MIAYREIGGHAYGPRYMTDVVPYMFFFLIPVVARLEWRRRALRTAFVILAGAGLWLHWLGAWRWQVYEWNSTPVDINQAPQRVWDWHDPPFLRPYR